ncbi:MAG: TIGR00730 family Rossman fold protein [Patescibacteria group bacterium]|nr:TIGR00730 family Rossman fold protein [Patescibacteria group bacterium]
MVKKKNIKKKDVIVSKKKNVLKNKVIEPEMGRPFYKGTSFKSRAAKLLDVDKRFVHWVCSPKGDCEQVENIGAFTDQVYWRIFRIMAEFIEGFEFLSKLQREVTFFGSARTNPKAKEYKMAVELGKMCAKAGYTVITGGGPGIMEAGNKGAFEAGGESVGIDIELPTEQRRNGFVTRAMGFHYFFTRKVMLSASAQAYVFFPGGFGTMDEAMEMITLVQTGKIPKIVPCIFIGRDHWQPFKDWVTKSLYKNKYINKADLDLMQIVDTPEEAFKIIKKTSERRL